jgi:hypothetical protein
MSGVRRAAALAGAGAALFASLLVGSASISGAATESTVEHLSGYRGSAAASGVQVDYTPQGILPIPALIDIGAPDAVATIAAGPTTYAQASVLDPGDLIANPDALLTQASPQWPSGTIPAYPYRVTANSGFGAPATESTPAPGLNARVAADSRGSTARATAPAVQAGLATIGSMSALATTVTDGEQVTVHSVSTLSDITVMGSLSIGALVTDLTATTRGANTTITGGSRVVGATLGGVPVTIDGTGIHANSGADPLNAALTGAVANVNDAFANAGIRITLAPPNVSQSKKSADVRAGGLRIDFDKTTDSVPALKMLLDLYPGFQNPIPGAPLGPDDFIAAVRAHHVAALTFGRGAVALTARSAIADIDVDVDVGVPFDTGFSSVPVADVPLPAFTPGGAVPRVAGVGVRRPATKATRSSTTATGVGVGAFLLLALLAQPLFGERLARLSTSVLGGNEEDHCDAEGL